MILILPGQIFYQAIKDKEYRIFHIKNNKYLTTIKDSEYTYHREWDSLEDAKNYLMKKMKENENSGGENDTETSYKGI